MRPNRPGARRSARLAAVALLIAVIAAPLSAAAKEPASTLKLRSIGGFKLLGRLPEPTENGVNVHYVISVNPERHVMYYLWTHGVDVYLREYDLRPTVPQVKRDVFLGSQNDLPIGYASPYTMQIDTKSNRLMMLVNGPAGSIVQVVDLNTFKVAAAWDLQTVAPGFVGEGLTYSPEDGRVYVLGSVSGNVVGVAPTGAAKPAQASAVLALEPPKDPTGGATLAWFRPFPQCQQVMDTYAVGALIARSRRTPDLYFACVRADPWPGESGVVRVTISPKAGPSDALNFPVSFFPVSGGFTSPVGGIVGAAGFDYKGDRLFVQSQAFATPGAWVFDGKVSSWVGFIAAPDPTNLYMGMDQGSGHYYIGGNAAGGTGAVIDNGYLVVSDGRATPVPQGKVLPSLGARGFIAADPGMHRVFVPMDLAKYGLAPEGSDKVGYVVFKDQTPLEKPPTPLDYDELTTNLPEGPDVVTSFSGDVNGFGARAVVVGGYGGLLSASGHEVTLDRLRSGDRGFTAARVPSLDLRSAGAAATSQALISDSNTDAELHDAGAGDWQWPPASCLDGSGNVIDNESSGSNGESKVHCDLAKQNASASSSFDAVAAGPVTVGHSSFDSTVWRDAKAGVITQTVASATGVKLAGADGQTVSIAEVSATSTTVAHGRPGSAKATWQRTLTGVKITDAKGKVTQELGSCSTSAEQDSCKDLLTAINDALQIKMRVDLPTPQITKTPKGAFAGVQQSDRDYFEGKTVNNQGTTFSGEAASRALPALQVTVFNDSMEKSRLLVQLAAIQANSIYTNSLPPEYENPPSTGGGGGGAPTTTSTGGASGSFDTTGAAPASSGDLGDLAASSGNGGAPVTSAPVLAQAPEGVLAFLTRSPKEALLFAGVWLLFAGAGAAIVRRRTLLGVLTGTGS
jgi:hypothetical protein